MMIDDKYIIRNRYSAVVPPTRKTKTQVEALQKANKPRRVQAQSEQHGEQQKSSKHHAKIEKDQDKNKDKAHTTVKQTTSSASEANEANVQHEKNVTISQEYYAQLVEASKRLHELEQLTRQLCTFSVKNMTRMQIHYRATINRTQLSKLFHYTMQSNEATFNRFDTALKEVVIDEIDSSP